MLWLALVFPQLLIDAADLAPDVPQLVAGRLGSRRAVLQCNAVAREQGIRRGQPLNAAVSLCPDAHILEEAPAQQQAALHQQAVRALQYSSAVSTRGSDVVLLEIAGSLKLFGGEQALLKRVVRDVKDAGFLLLTGVGPTPLAAELLARAGHPHIVRTREELSEQIAAIDTRYLPFDASVRQALHKAGLRQCAQLLALPVDAVTRRFGQQTGQQLFRLLGKLPDLQTPVQADAVFDRTLDLPLETDNSHILQFALNRLLTALSDFLRVRDCGVIRLKLTLQHRHIAPTQINAGFSEPVCRRRHLLKICMERLERTQLPAPALQVRLSATQFLPMRHETTPLLHDDRHRESDSLAALLDRLSARLGEHAVYQPGVRDTHLPEQASHRQPVSVRVSDYPLRPLWLFDTPQAAPPSLRIGQTERLENGWYQGEDQRRDYALARDTLSGRWYWVFRNSTNAHWQVHGLFV